MILDSVQSPADLRRLTPAELKCLAQEIREFIVDSVSRTGGHLGSNLGAVELTIALHRVFDSPRDILLWDTGHQAYVHKLLTGRLGDFGSLRQQGGLSGYPNRTESPHDWIENSHASTALSYAHGLATALELGYEPDRPLTGAQDERGRRRVVAVVGDGALTGGMAYEALNNLGHSGRRVVIVLNDNGRSYAPTVSRLSESLTKLRLNPAYTAARSRIKQALRELPALGGVAYSTLAGLTTALREAIEPHVFFEALGVRYSGPLDGHDIGAIETALSDAAAWKGPIVVHLLTHKGYGYAPAEEDQVQCLHDLKVSPVRVATGSPAVLSYTDAFTSALLEQGGRDARVVALTAAMPGPTGLLPFKARFPDRFFDVGIAEQHLVTSAAGMAMGGLRPVVAVYSTFFSRAFDQANLDVGLHRLPVVFALDRAGLTGDDGPSHHGLLDLVQALSIPGMTVFAPSSSDDIAPMLRAALDLGSPCSIRFPKTPSPQVQRSPVGPMSGRRLRRGDGAVCLLAVGKMVSAAEQAAAKLARQGIDASVWDVRVVRPADPRMIADALAHKLVVTIEDGIRTGGAGTWLAAVMAESAPDRGELPAVAHLGVPLEFIPQAKPDDILARLRLDADGVAQSVIDQMDFLFPGVELRVDAD
ncbi:MAG: 1-deoxy-D-xylulose-5-phosphate synthase [Actinomycetota bacterium]|nr:1-deoxy-D-xylulose-5-phosphate synthase [Actinomycetota bacterium]